MLRPLVAVLLLGSASPALGQDVFREALGRAVSEGKSLVVFFAPERDCRPCESFHQRTLRHPIIERRLPGLVFATVPIPSEETATSWRSPAPGVALYDLEGTLRLRWETIPDAALLGSILDVAMAVAPNFVRARDAKEPAAGELEIATALAGIARPDEARVALDNAQRDGSSEVRQLGVVVAALLDARAGKTDEALAVLESVAKAPLTRAAAAEASLVIGAILQKRGELAKAADAYWATIAAGDADSRTTRLALTALEQLEKQAGLVRILPFTSQVLSGKQVVRTNVASTSVARVVFLLDGKEVARAERPPYAARIDFGVVPQPRTLAAIALDRAQREVGRDEIQINDGGEIFWIRMTEPREGMVSGETPVALAVRTPPTRRVVRAEIRWNDRAVATLVDAPWRASVNIPEGQIGILQAVIELDDGRTAEDAVLLNAIGGVERTEVQLVELPVTARDRSGEPAIGIVSGDISIREQRRSRGVESVTPASESPLTVAIALDVSASMRDTLPDLQEAAIRFLDTLLTERDRAMVITFDTRARLLQPATSDRDLLRRTLLHLRPAGLTALYDAMILGLLQFEGVKGRRALVVFTDGVDRTSDHVAADLRDVARRSNVPIFVVTGVARHGNLSMPPPIRGRPLLKSAAVAESELWQELIRELGGVARSTGGQLFELKSLDRLGEIYDDIGRALRAQLLVTFRSDAGGENEWRAIDVSIPRRSLRVHAPSGYYAPR